MDTMSILKTRTDKLSVREFLQSAGTRNSDRTKTDHPKNERKHVGTDFFDISNEVIVKVRGSVRAKKERGTNFYDHLKESDRKSPWQHSIEETKKSVAADEQTGPVRTFSITNYRQRASE